MQRVPSKPWNLNYRNRTPHGRRLNTPALIIQSHGEQQLRAARALAVLSRVAPWTERATFAQQRRSKRLQYM